MYCQPARYQDPGHEHRHTSHRAVCLLNLMCRLAGDLGHACIFMPMGRQLHACKAVLSHDRRYIHYITLLNMEKDARVILWIMTLRTNLAHKAG